MAKAPRTSINGKTTSSRRPIATVAPTVAQESANADSTLHQPLRLFSQSAQQAPLLHPDEEPTASLPTGSFSFVLPSTVANPVLFPISSTGQSQVETTTSLILPNTPVVAKKRATTRKKRATSPAAATPAATRSKTTAASTDTPSASDQL